MQQIGYSLIDSGGSELQCWGDIANQCAAVPSMIVLPNGDQVHCPSPNVTYGLYKLVERWLQFNGSQSSVLQDGKIVITRPEPEPAQSPPQMVAAAFNLTIANGDVTSIGGAFNLVAALYMGVGQFMLLFLKPEADAGYFVNVNGDAPVMRIVDQQTDYLTVEARDANGSYVNPTRFDVQVYRI